MECYPKAVASLVIPSKQKYPMNLEDNCALKRIMAKVGTSL
jgi:hypothetical protein